jgi:hypothetical protein
VKSGIEALSHWLGATAARDGLETIDRHELASKTFRGTIDGSEDIGAAHLPLEVSGLTVGGRPVLVGSLPESLDATEISGAMRRYRNQAVIARSRLTPDETADLHLFLASPVGAQGDQAWRQAALAIERDERVCRKLVWLRPSTEDQEAASFEVFAGRTFLARPWRHGPLQTGAQLDRFSRLVDVIGDAGVPRSVVEEWLSLSADENTEWPELVDELIEAYRRRLR